jgi:hypothetical protein
MTARLLESKTHLLPGKLKVSELFWEVPKDHSKPSGSSLQLFARSVTKYEKPIVPLSEDEEIKAQNKPWFVYLQVNATNPLRCV